MTNKPYALYYWPIPFRGQFVRDVLAYIGAEWDEPPVDRLLDLKAEPPGKQPLPFMAPPLLHDRTQDFWLSQSPAILTYLGNRHGLMPPEIEKQALVQKVIGDAGDVLEEITRNGGRQMWTRADWDAFLRDRLILWIQIFEALGHRNGLTETDGSMLGTPAPCLADLVTATLWGTIASKLPPLAPVLRENAPCVMALTDRIGGQPGIAAHRREQDARLGPVYCGGEIEESLRAVLAI